MIHSLQQHLAKRLKLNTSYLLHIILVHFYDGISLTACIVDITITCMVTTVPLGAHVIPYFRGGKCDAFAHLKALQYGVMHSSVTTLQAKRSWNSAQKQYGLYPNFRESLIRIYKHLLPANYRNSLKSITLYFVYAFVAFTQGIRMIQVKQQGFLLPMYSQSSLFCALSTHRSTSTCTAYVSVRVFIWHALQHNMLLDSFVSEHDQTTASLPLHSM